LLLLAACRKEGKVNPPSPATPGVEQPMGESTGDGIETVVGAQGGTLVAHDGRLTVVIPAGALSEDITIGIEPITRTLADAPENATKGAYRLTPHGQTFLKPIKIIFRRSDANLPL
jgi:hypothetical protein